ncbi:MAG: hypothetical protein IPP17_30320 [Bacteroidetes bacterium]|nr:hypothetical protein [Bacteroidota bacterium]
MEEHQCLYFVLRDFGIYWGVTTSSADFLLVKKILDDHGYDLSRSTREQGIYLEKAVTELFYERFGAMVWAELPQREMQSEGGTFRHHRSLETLVYTFGERFSVSLRLDEDLTFSQRTWICRCFENALATDEVVEVFLNIDEPTPIPVAEIITKNLELARLRFEQRRKK